MLRRLPTLALLFCLAFAAHATAAPPAWVADATMYQVNLRQATAEGTAKAFGEQHLDRLDKLGVKILWFMPVHPIGELERNGKLGSPYAVRDYKAFNPELGTLDEFKTLVDDAHERGMHVILDWVANHTAPDHVWLADHPDWFTRDEAGNTVFPVPEWQDVIDLDFDKPAMRRAMIDAMKFWVVEASTDGFRCDAAIMVPEDFWQAAREELDAIKPLFWLAEAVEPELMAETFDATYGWHLSTNLELIAKGEKTAEDLKNYLVADERVVPDDGFRLNFTNNHDKNSWECTAKERFGDSLDAMTVLTFTVPGMPLIYNGQEAGLDKRLAFFERDPIDWDRDLKAEKLYRNLIEFKAKHEALSTGHGEASIRFLKSPPGVITFVRSHAGDEVSVVVNCTDEPIVVDVAMYPGGVDVLASGVMLEGFKSNSDGRQPLGQNVKLGAWGYVISAKPNADEQ